MRSPDEAIVLIMLVVDVNLQVEAFRANMTHE